jgi:phosphatidylserine/phosphatidylglycerophosphate/cardiolipin synthase-like enzyme
MRGLQTDRTGLLAAGLDDNVFAAERPVRQGNSIEVLVDGEAAPPAMAAAIAGARSYVHIAGWHASPDFRLIREPAAPTLRELLAEVAQRVPVRVLLWAGPPMPIFQPTRRMGTTVRDGFTAARAYSASSTPGNVRCTAIMRRSSSSRTRWRSSAGSTLPPSRATGTTAAPTVHMVRSAGMTWRCN